MLQCEDCGWTGEGEDTIRVYGVPEDYLKCPKCGSENLSELRVKGARLPETTPVR